ncbi:MucR family transcriptional regulator [Sphingomonas sp. So64.6b]|uniref:MucR family transcriptional regulator n=1 Tax=Sphingomonas sp. So64.6b TaxID=2997354 RepID=UPI0015FED13E|nr:MucR family transcriptional regulator [Sphingomonas sp. So64.6b]QNA83331.1 MucR family transcriptional regulator [Sphingomonas sp. So64.6b]
MNDPAMLVALTADIAASFVSNNRVGTGEIGGMIKSVHDALTALSEEVEPEAPVFAPAVTARKSLANPAKIISMIDGKSYSMLKRHISQHGLTPAEYRARYNLPADYPMTAPAYSEQRKALAVKIGLGRKAKPAAAAAPKGRRKLGVATPAKAPPKA